MKRWSGFKEGIVWKKVQENAHIWSFYIKLEEGLVEYQPGQFIAVRIPLGEEKYSKVRQYTLSTVSNEKYYRISVKREEEGEVSKLLCDQVEEGDSIQISAPSGKFVLQKNDSKAVFIGGGIGITPMLTMAMQAARQERESHLVYSLPNSEFMVFGDEIKKLADENKRLRTTIAYSRPKGNDILGRDFQKEGRLTKEWMEENLDKDAEAYLCGPVEFMRTVYHLLLEIGISDEKIYYELFQNGEDIRKKVE